LFEGITAVKFLRDFILCVYTVNKDLQVQHTPIFCDNSNAVNLASSIKFITRTKTLTLLTFGINKKLPERIKVHHVNTEDQAADIFAKSLARPFLEKCKKKLGLVSSKEM
jgi:hypothetical protein